MLLYYTIYLSYMVIFQGQIILKQTNRKTRGCYCCFRSSQSWWHKAQMHTDAPHWTDAETAATPQGFSRTLAPGDSWPLPSEFWGELILWTLGDSSGTETGVVVVVAVVGAVVAPTASARSGGRSSSSLRLLKAHEALLITIINRLWGVEVGGEGWDG